MSQPLAQILKASSHPTFRGFASPTSNTTYAPNQFFDVCLPRHSRGCVRLVGLLIRKTLGWCDEEGRPQAERHVLSWADFERAGISREMIRGALDEAIQSHFISCVREPKSQKAGQPALSGLYELKWDERPAYIKDPKEFRGFFAGEGNRTYIPNQFFDEVIPHEPLAVVKIVGSVIRFSIGFRNKWGHQRRNVSLSYQHIQNYSLIRDRKSLSAAILHAIGSNYIERVEEGYFDRHAGKLSRAAVYAVKWLNQATDAINSQKTPPGNVPVELRSEKPTDNGQKNPPEERSEIPTDIEIKQRNKTYKQDKTPSALAPEAAATFEKLRGEGFDDAAARTIACRFSFDHVERQITWMVGRKVRSNRLGMLRKAIEENWHAPPTGNSLQLGQPNSHDSRGEDFTGALARIRSRFSDQTS